MNKSRRGFLKSALGLAVAQAFLRSDPPDETLYTTRFHWAGTITGRLTSWRPEIQDLNWDRTRWKDEMVKMDYTAAEERILSQMAGYKYAVEHMNDYLFGTRTPDQRFRLIQFDYHPMDMLKPYNDGGYKL